MVKVVVVVVVMGDMKWLRYNRQTSRPDEPLASVWPSSATLMASDGQARQDGACGTRDQDGVIVLSQRTPKQSLVSSGISCTAGD